MGNWAKRQKKKAANKRRSEHGECHFNGCQAKGTASEHCVLCEKQVAEGKREPADAFRVSFCRLLEHSDAAQRKMERHILTKHKGTIPAWLLAKLTGRA
jgi:hypothetical protein